MAWPGAANTPGDRGPLEQRRKALAEEERRLAEETARLRREMTEKAEKEAADARLARIREENPHLAAQEKEEPVPVLRHSAARRQDRARFFVLLFLLALAVLWIVRVLR